MIFLTLMFACSGGKTDVEMECSDGMDDDNDGLIDCEDWDCSSACIGDYEEDTSDTGDKEEEDKEEDTGEMSDPFTVDCSDASYQNPVIGSYGGNEYTFNAVMWDGNLDGVVMYMVSDTSGDVNQPCNDVVSGTLAESHLYIRTFDLESMPTQLDFVEPQGGRENYAVMVDNPNDVKDAAKSGSISLDDFDLEAPEEAVASAFSISEFVGGAGSMESTTITACFCPGLISALDEE